MMLFVVSAWGQSDIAIPVQKRIYLSDTLIHFDSVSVWPGFFHLKMHEKTIADSLYDVDFVKGILHWKNRETMPRDSLTVFYYRYPAAWYKDLVFIPSVTYEQKEKMSLYEGENHDFFDGLKTSGFWEKGMLAGNRQDVSAPGKLDLTLQGHLARDIKVSGHIYDDNLPDGYQGISTPVKDINRMYLTGESKRWKLFAGDIMWQFRTPVFAFRRDNKGIGMAWKEENFGLDVRAASVKGKFYRKEFNLRSDEYGPFLLDVPGNDTYVYILSGSEKVYLNGRLLQRGEDKDYVIDYGTAELRLNPKLAVNVYDVLTVDFLYANRRYRRWSGFIRQTKKNRYGDWSVFMFNETDIKSKPLLVAPDSSQIRFLEHFDGKTTAYVIQIRRSAYSADKILYKKHYTGTDFYFEYQQGPPSPGDTLYEVQFRYTGNRRGAYRVDRILSAGKVMTYVGEGNGDYSVYWPLEAPENNVFYGLSNNFRYRKFSWRNDWVLNRYNPNTFYMGNNRENALAFRSAVQYDFSKDTVSEKSVRFSWQHLPARYHIQDRIFPADFTKIWDLPDPSHGRSDWATFEFIRKDSVRQSNIRLHRFLLRDSIRFWRGDWTTEGKKGGWSWEGNDFWMSGQQSAGDHEDFYHFEHQFSKRFNRWTTLLGGTTETRDLRRGNIADSLNYRYFMFSPEITYRKDKWQWSISDTWTTSDSIRENRWSRRFNEHNYRTSLSRKGALFRWKLSGGYRSDILNPHKDTWLFSGEMSAETPSKITVFSLSGQRFAARVPVREVVFVRVPDGQGQYKWVDYNGNGLQEPDEFEAAYYSDQADYIKVLLPSRKYRDAYTNSLHIDWDLNLMKTGVKGFWKNWKNRLQIDLNQQTSEKSLQKSLAFRSGNLLNGHQKISDVLVFNPLSNITLRYEGKLMRRAENLYFGRQESFTRRHVWTAVWHIRRFWIVKPSFERISLLHAEEEFPYKNYDIEGKIWHLPVQWKSKRSFISLGWNHSAKGALYSPENLTADEIFVTWQYSDGRKKRFRTSFRYVLNRFGGNVYSPAGYVLLEGLQPGKNAVFDMNWNYRLSADIFLDMQYQMRAAEHSPVIHTGSIRMRVNF